MIIQISDAAKLDLLEGSQFYENQEENIGSYFLDSLYSDIDSLKLYAGIHRKKLGSRVEGQSHTLTYFLNFVFFIDKKRVREGNFKSGASVCREADNGRCAAKYGQLGEPSLPILIEKTQPCRQCHRYRKAFAAMFAIIF